MTTRPRKRAAKVATPAKPARKRTALDGQIGHADRQTRLVAYVIDLGERVLSTFVEAFAGVFTVTAVASAFDARGLVDWAILEKLGAAGLTAGVVAVGALIKGLLAKRIGDRDTASLIGTSPTP